MVKCSTLKFLGVSLLTVCASQAVAQQKNSHWLDFSDPTAIYSKAGFAGGTEGVDLFAALGGYLGGQFKHRLTVEAMHDLDFYNVSYFAFNTGNDTGFRLDTKWDNESDKASLGVVKKLTLENKNIKLYPAMNLGMIWGDEISSTTYIELDMAVRYTVNRHFWVGVTPVYTYAMKGLDIKELHATLEAGYQLAKDVVVSAHINDDKEAWADLTFAF